MIRLINLFSVQTFSSYFQGEKRRLPILPFVILFLLAIVQINFIDTNRQESGEVVLGLFVVGLFLFYTLFGLMTTRLPARMEDVIWIYSSPISNMKIVIAVALWQIILRGSLWIGSALIADVYILLAKGYYPGILLKAVFGLFIFLVLECWLVAISCARYHLILKLSSIVGFLIMLSITVFVLYQYMKNGVEGIAEPFLDLSEQVGLFFLGEPTVMNSAILFVLLLASIIIMYVSTERNPSFKEKIVREADFWSGFGDHQSFFNSIHNISEKPSWWGGKYLTGIHSFAWFEMAAARKDVFVHIIQSIIMLLLLWGAAKWSQFALILLLFIIAVSHLLNGFFSGTVKHSLTGELFLLPGSIFKKIFYLEGLSVIPIFFYIAAGLAFGIVYSEFSLWPSIATLATFFIVLVGVRFFIFTQTYTENETLTIQAYFKNSLLVVASLAANVYFILLFSQWMLVVLYLLVIGIALGLCSIVLFRKYSIVKYYFSFSIVICLVGYGIMRLS